MPQMPTRDQAMALLREFNQSDRAIKHAQAVEAAMRYLARKAGQNEDLWGVVGLIHDLDYEQFPDQHCRKTVEILRQRDWPEEIIRAAESHGWGICSQADRVGGGAEMPGCPAKGLGSGWPRWQGRGRRVGPPTTQNRLGHGQIG